MATPREPRLVTDISQIAEKIRFARSGDEPLGKVVFLIGAGCSISAGIPSAIEIARRMVREVAHRFDCCGKNDNIVGAYNRLTANKHFDRFVTGKPDSDLTEESIDWYKVYDEMSHRHYTAPDDMRDLFSTIMDEADGAINWAHLCLGELVAHKYVSTVLTTNFDQLVLSGMVRAGVLPVVCDGIEGASKKPPMSMNLHLWSVNTKESEREQTGISSVIWRAASIRSEVFRSALESLHRIDGAPRHPQLVELHGSRHTYLLRNSRADVESVGKDSQASSAIQTLLHHATTFVAVGYGGREEGVMDLLIEAAKVYRDKNLYWVSYSSDPEAISDKVREFLSTSKHAGLCLGQDADTFFLDLCQRLKIGSRRAISQPLETVERVISEVSKSKVTDPAIQAEIEAATDRTARLKAYDSKPLEMDPVLAKISLIRENRLAGQHAEAYRLAKEALERPTEKERKP